MTLPKLPATNAQAAIAFAIIGLAFFLIGYMIWVQDHTTSETRTQIEEMIKSPTHLTLNQTITLINGLQETDRSNQTTFNVLLPVFAAWVTTVVAFYFHTQVQNQSQQTINNLSSQISGQLSDITIAELLRHYPDSKNVVMVQSTDQLNEVQEKCTKFGNVVVTDENGKPLGILYSSSLLSLGNAPKPILKDNFEKITDPITESLWAKEGKVNNFATLTLQDLVSEAKKKMDDVKLNDQRIRGLVIDSGKVANIVNYQMLTQPLSNL